MKKLKPITDNKGEVHDIYLENVRKVLYGLDKPKVLKTDCYNEVHDQPEGGIAPKLDCDLYLAEIDKGLVATCHQKYPELNLICGDIRNLPFRDMFFDVVVDLSTLDHVRPSEAALAISEYHRVLKTYGRLLLVVWTGLNKKAWAENKNDDGQYYFRKKRLEKHLELGFKTTNHSVIYEEDFRRLHCYFLEKK